jgi:hypothetical protein
MAELDYAQVTTTSTYTAEADISGLSIDVDIPANAEPTWVEFGCSSLSNNATGVNTGSKIYIYQDGVKIDAHTWYDADANSGSGLTCRTRCTPTAGAHTYKARCGIILGGTATLSAGTADPGPAYITAFQFT